MSDFFQLSDLGLTTDTSSLLQVWQAYLQDFYPGYVPGNANLEYLMAIVFATWAADIAGLCSSGGTELFIQYGQKLFNLPILTGQSATAVLQITAIDDNGYTLPSGSQFLLDSTAGFQTFQDNTIPFGSTTMQVTIAANTPGTAANGLGNVSVISNQYLSWVSGVTLVTSSSGGVDPETADDYVVRLAQQIQIAAPRPITASDFATISLDFTPAIGTDQEEIGRAVAVDGYNPSTTSFTGHVTSASSTITNVAATSGISINSIISGAGITLGSLVTAINGSSAATAQASAGSNTLTISYPASATATSASLTATGTYYNQRTVTVCVTDNGGMALTADTLAALEAWLESMREVNFIVNVVNPTYNPIYVTVNVYRNPTYSATTVQQNVQNTLVSLLSPAGWGIAPDSSGTVWFNTSNIYQSVIEAAIQNTDGVDHIQTGSLSVGLEVGSYTINGQTYNEIVAAPSGTDLALVGPFPLPSANAATIPLSAITVLN